MAGSNALIFSMIFALIASNVNAATNNVYNFCRLVHNADNPMKDSRYKGPSTTPEMLNAVHANEDQAGQVSWRCMNNKVLACIDSNAPVCGKSLKFSEKPNVYETNYCHQHPNAPMVEATHGEWGCRGKTAVPTDTGPTDKRGYSPMVWSVVNPN